MPPTPPQMRLDPETNPKPHEETICAMKIKRQISPTRLVTSTATKLAIIIGIPCYRGVSFKSHNPQAISSSLHQVINKVKKGM